ncbi:hypothetical protein HJC23_012093 [Cyclotella cryptica]|uniref:Uncharacterized protein n=1 Tax=Cyclotella cryptica TaxID=29204 RepID=A0ABD3PSM0_9STRA|eukprot:CCRYP_011697-RA/>CCRYP_011697-RA protein AED:0.09 eAED:0.09 QI:344/1/1/1/1/1/2/679/294
MITTLHLIILGTIQCCFAFNLPNQWAGVSLANPHHGAGSSANANALRRLHQHLHFSRAISLHVTPFDERYSSAEEGNTGDRRSYLDPTETLPFTARDNVGGYDPMRDKLGLQRQTANVGAPQTIEVDPESTSTMNITQVMTELQAIQSQGPKKYCILGTRHCSFLHQQIVEMLAYALVLSGNHLYTSGAQGTNAAAIRGALRAFQPNLLTVVLPQSMSKQTPESQELLEDVTNVITMPQNDHMPLDVASRICNSHLLSQTDHLISFAFHESRTVLEAAEEAYKLEMLVTLLYLD